MDPGPDYPVMPEPEWAKPKDKTTPSPVCNIFSFDMLLMMNSVRKNPKSLTPCIVVHKKRTERLVTFCSLHLAKYMH